MKKILLLFLAVSFMPYFCYAEETPEELTSIIREAQEANNTVVAVEGYLVEGNIFEVAISARMKREKPNIHNAIVVGPGIGRLSCETKETLVATTEEEDAFLTKRKDKAFISFDKDESTKKVDVISESNVKKGRLTKALYRFMIPRDKIKQNKKYKLWVQVLSSQKGSKYDTFKFDLENFAEILSR